MRVAVVIGDIVASRRSANRKRLQQQLAASVETVNHPARRPPGSLASPYTITLGDEVQAVYSRPSLVVLDLLAFKAQMWPERMRFCVGIGEITTLLNPNAAIGMDGPAFYSAREGIEELKKESDVSLAVKSATNTNVDLEDAAVKLIDAGMADWRATRFKVLLAKLQNADAKTISAQLAISAAAVYKNISDGHIALLLRAAEAAGQSLASKLASEISEQPSQKRRAAKQRS